GFAGTQGANAKRGALHIHDNVRKAERIQPRKHSRGRKRNKSASDMAEPLQPAVADFHCEECASGLQHAMNFREGFLLLLLRFHWKEDKAGNPRRKRPNRKRQSGGNTLQDIYIGVLKARAKPRRKVVIVFKAGDAARAAA